MQIVINIPEHTFNYIHNGGSIGASLLIENAIKNGTPIPKEHGHLIDISTIDSIELEDSLHCMTHVKGDDVWWEIIAPIVLKGTR